MEFCSGSGRKGWSWVPETRFHSPPTAVSARRLLNEGEEKTQAGCYGHPEATLRLPRGHLVANR